MHSLVAQLLLGVTGCSTSAALKEQGLKSFNGVAGLVPVSTTPLSWKPCPDSTLSSFLNWTSCNSVAGPESGADSLTMQFSVPIWSRLLLMFLSCVCQYLFSKSISAKTKA